MSKQRAFTLSELLSAIVVVWILSVILLPPFIQARDHTNIVTCLSNEKRIGGGILQYTQDYDNYFPASFYGQNNWAYEVRWFDVVAPYVNHNKGVVSADGHQYGIGGVWHCPAFPSPQDAEYGVHEFIFPGSGCQNSGPCDPGNGTLDGPVVLRTALSQPTNTIIVLEKGQLDGNSNWPFFTPSQSHWTDHVGNPVGSVNTGVDWSVTDGGPDLSAGLHHNCDQDYSATTAPNWGSDYGNCGSMPRYRHQNSCNVIFADGHAKSMKAYGIVWATNIYDPTVWANTCCGNNQTTP
jgi:prepilin-type processing-associated H-X9-DG protein